MTLAYLLSAGPPSGDDFTPIVRPHKAAPDDLRKSTAENVDRDADCVERLASSDDILAGAAFDTVVRRYYAVLCASADSYLRDRAAAEEVTDAVFARLWDRRSTLGIRTTLAAYLFGAVRNASFHVVDKRRFAERRGAQAVADGEPPGAGRAAPGPAEAVELSELRAAVWAAIESLPERARAILVLRWRLQLEWPEVADAMEMTPNAVQIQHSRALKTLRERVPGLADFL